MNATPTLSHPRAISLEALPPTTGLDPLGESPLFELIAAFARRRNLFVTTAAVIFATGVAVLLLQPPMYRAETAVLFDPRSRQIFTFTPVVSGYNEDSQALEVAMATELQLVLSRAVIDPVIDRFGLAADPEFSPTTPGLPTRVIGWLETHFPELTPVLAHVSSAHRAAPAPDDRRSAALRTFETRLSAELQGHSTVIDISFASRTPAKAAMIVNALAESYVQLSVKERTSAVADALTALAKRSDELRDEADAAELAVADYRTSAHLVEGSGGKVSAAQVTELSTELVRARAELALGQARLLALGRGGSEELASPIIQRLRETMAETSAKLAHDQATYGTNHPVVQAEVDQLARLRQQIQGENQVAAAAQRTAVDAASTRVRLLSSDLAEVWNQAAADTRANVRLRELELNASVKHSLYESQLRRVQEVSLQLGTAQPYAKIISAAEAPHAPASPNLRLLVPALAIVSMAVSAATILLAELLNKTFSSTWQVERIFGGRTVEMLPRIGSRWPGWFRLSRGRAELGTANPYSEAVDGLRVRLDALGPRQKTVLFSSALSQEGKTTAAIAFARREALAGRKVLLIDADLRRACVHIALGGRREGLSDLLLDGTRLDRLVQRDLASGLAYLAAGRRHGSPTDLLGSQIMGELLRDCESCYDRVVIDSPPVLATADARVLTGLAALTIYLIRWRSTPRRLACLGFEVLRASGGTLVGPIFVETDEHHTRYVA